MSTARPTARSHRARVASLTRSRLPSDPDLISARRELAAEVIANHVRKVVEKSPPLTDEQIDRIAAILQSGA